MRVLLPGEAAPKQKVVLEMKVELQWVEVLIYQEFEAIEAKIRELKIF